MKFKFWRNLFALMLIASFMISGCAGLTSDIVESTKYSAMKVEASSCDYGGEIRSVEALDEYSVKFTLCNADAAFPKKMASPIFAIQDKAYLDSHQGGSLLLSFQTNGTGPYYSVGFTTSGTTKLRVSPTYWGTPPRITDVYFNKIEDSELENPVLTISDGDVFNLVPSSSLKNTLSTDSSFTSISHQAKDIVYLGFNNNIEPVNNVIVRQAIATALNRNVLVQDYMTSGTAVASQLIPSDIFPGWSRNVSWYEYLPNSAKEMLDSINFNYNKVFTLAYVSTPTNYSESPDDLVKAVRDQLANIGLNIALKPMTQDQFDVAMSNGSEMMFIGDYQVLYDDGAAFYEIPVLRQTKRFGSAYNELQIQLVNALSSSSDNTRQDKFDTLNLTFKTLVPFIPLAHTENVSYFKNSVSSYGSNIYSENYEQMYNSTGTLKVYGVNYPKSLWPADETDDDTFRITTLIYDTLVTDGYGNVGLQPSLADSWESNSDLTEWTFYLRYNVKFRNGASLDANDVVASFAAIWDTSSKNHVGDTGNFEIFKELFGNLINTAQ